MKQDNDKLFYYYLIIFGMIPVGWFALLMAPAFDDGLIGLMNQFQIGMDHPFKIQWGEDSLRAVLIFLLIYFLSIGVYWSTRKNYRRLEEHGSAKWGNPLRIVKRYREEEPCRNVLLTRHMCIGLDGRKHRRNINIIVVGGSGAGKTRCFCLPNILQANTSFVILDPKGEILRTVGKFLEEQGYVVKVLDLINMEKSHCYNPFVYLKTDNDVQKLVTSIFKSTTPKGAQGSDPFWDTAASMLLLAIIFYLKYEAPEEEQNFQMVMEMLRAGAVKEDDEYYQSPLDNLFFDLEARQPNHIAVKYYRDYRSGSAKTLKSIQITLASRLEKFNLDGLASLTATDELDLGSMAERKTALFAIIPDNDTSFNFLVSILYTQLFQILSFLADHKYKGFLPVQVQFIMDEFSNVSLPDDFDKIVSVIRSRGVSVAIILQNLAQLKKLFEKEWESIVGNCDSFLYLGGNEASTHKYISEQLGKATIDMNTYGKSEGKSGSYSTNYQITGRELLTPDEVRMLDNQYAILLLRGERPIMDLKYDLMKHPNIAFTSEGEAEPYEHGKGIENILVIEWLDDAEAEELKFDGDLSEWIEVLSEYDLQLRFEKEERESGGKKNEK